MCFKRTDIWLPKKALDPGFMQKWGVIACDQYTSDMSYWQNAKQFVGDEMSALNLVFPEIYLEAESKKEQEKRMADIATFMAEYEKELVCHHDSMFYIERTLKNGAVRRGLLGAVDLDEYDFKKDSQTKIRPTEETVPGRLPPRVKIRENALFELPHAMLLYDDQKDFLMANIANSTENFTKLYDFELMCGSGKIKCYSLDDKTMDQIEKTLPTFEKDGIALAMGDGNHSLAAAKQCWENLKKTLPKESHANHPARYALAEIVNIYDRSLEFEPIYRLLFDAMPDDVIEKLKAISNTAPLGANKCEYEIYCGGEYNAVTIESEHGLPVKALQLFLDEYTAKYGGRLDYVHGKAETIELAKNAGAIGFVFETMKKSELFSAVAKEGALPRKTFSMGEARDKRFYIECRKIK